MPAQFFGPIRTQATPPVYSYFNGDAWKTSTSGKTMTIVSPIDGASIGEVQQVTAHEISGVFDTAKKAQPLWESKSLSERIKVMLLAADWIRHFQNQLTSQLVSEIGKTVSEANSEISRTADLIEFTAREVVGLKGETIESDAFPGFAKGKTAIVERTAHGIVVAIAPFNYPVNLAVSKIVPALLMGNSVIFKPPTQGSIVGLHITRIFEKAGVPKGVLSCVTGAGKEIGTFLTSHKDVGMVAFTGSSEIGSGIAKHVGMKPMLFECGGNNPAVVFPDADITLTARELVKGAYAYAGQRCTAVKYVLATQSTFEKLMPVLEKSLQEHVKIGDPRSPETKLVGPLISVAAAVEVEERINDAVAHGAKRVMGGKRKAAYVEPTILSGVLPDMTIVTHETFGPIICCITITHAEQAASIINNSVYGLQASIFTRDEGRGIVFGRTLHVGTVQINGSPQRGPDHFPFLGIKASGVGVQGVRYSLEAMSRLRPIVLNQPA